MARTGIPGAARALRAAALATAALAAAGTALAGAVPEPTRLLQEGRDVPLDEWRAMTAGRTVWYRVDGEFWGRERYDREGDGVTFQFRDGECFDGSWRRTEDRWYCFDFGFARPHCFRHLELDGEFWALGVEGGVQKIERIDDAPLACGPDVVS